MKKYLDITVVIAPGTGGAYAVRVESSEAGQGHSTLKLPFTLRDLAGAVFGVAQTARALSSHTQDEVGRSAAADSRSATDFGVELFEALFQGEARDLLAATDSRAQSSFDTGVRIRLSMDLQGAGMAEVASLPWELMCRRGQRALALSTQTPLVRSLDAPRPTEPRPFRAPLRILALMSKPSGTAALNLNEERARIEQNWARLPGVQVDFVRPVQAELLNKLAEREYHVIHYMGHGDFNADAGGMLLLEREDGSPDRVTGDVFAMSLADQPLRLVFLNACKTGTTSVRSGVHPFAGVATALIRERVPAVVAMQFPISDQAAIAFAQTFYQRIAQGFPVDAAVAEGRKVLYSSKQAEWATPVLYLRSKDGMLFGSAGDDTAVASAAPVSQAQFTAAAASPAAQDPWGAGAGDAFRVFLARADQNLVTKHRQLSQALKGLDWVRVVDSVPDDDRQKHDAAVDSLVRRADLCVHLLGAHPGQRLDDDDPPATLHTYQLEQLSIGLKAARSQLVVMTSEDKESIGNQKYAARVDELAKLPRDKARFELVITDKNRITDAVLAKLEELKSARQAPLASSAPGGRGRSAFVDSHVSDEERALELVAYLEERNVNTNIQTSNSSAADFAHLDETVKKSSLYIIVAGNVDWNWVSHRKLAIMKSAVKSRAALLIAKYSAMPAEGADSVEVTISRFDISTLNDGDRSWVDALFAPAALDKE